MERPGLRARRLQTLDECHAGRPGVGETGLEERPLLLPTGQHSESKVQKRKSPPSQVGFFVLNMVGRVGFEPTTNWLKDNWPRFL